jgi:hypothetical protein
LLYWYAYALNNPLKYTDPSGELIPFFIVPSISWSKDGGIDISITAGIGFYKGLSAQSTIGYSFGSNNFYAQNGVSACGATAYYGWGSQSGNYCGVSYGLSNGSGLSSNAASLGVSYSENGGWGGNFSIFQINNQGDVSINPSLSYSYSFNNFKQVRVDERNRDNFQIILASYAQGGGGDPYSLYFNGSRLSIISPDGAGVFSVPAVSGRPDANGNFDYSRARQGMKGTGPLPAGKYYVNPQEMQHITEFQNAIGTVGGLFGMKVGKWPGGSYAWGEARVDIHGGLSTDRAGFTIHGGASWGSAGCIDTGPYIMPFLRSLCHYSNGATYIPLYVNYGN